MNTKNKIMTCLMLSAGGAVSLALLNKYIQFSATSRGLTREENSPVSYTHLTLPTNREV